MDDEQRSAALAQVLIEVLGDPLDDPAHLKLAGRVLESQIARLHYTAHAAVQRQGALLWGLRHSGASWHEIRIATGVTQRTAQRRIDLFCAEGIETQPEAELDARAYGEDHDD